MKKIAALLGMGDGPHTFDNEIPVLDRHDNIVFIDSRYVSLKYKSCFGFVQIELRSPVFSGSSPPAPTLVDQLVKQPIDFLGRLLKGGGELPRVSFCHVIFLVYSSRTVQLHWSRVPMQAQIECLCEGGASEQRPLKDFSSRQVPLAIEARCEIIPWTRVLRE